MDCLENHTIQEITLDEIYRSRNGLTAWIIWCIV